MFSPITKLSKEIPWNKQLQITWENIRDVAVRYLENELSVVVDFVVEDELEWFRQQIPKQVEIDYIVLMATPENLKERVVKRDGNDKYYGRSMELHEGLNNT